MKDLMQNGGTATDASTELVVVILNWNGLPTLKKTLPTIVANLVPSIGVLFVDNASSDESIPWVSSTHPGVAIVRNEANLGFAAGSNVGLRWALTNTQAKAIMTLNNDVFVRPGAFQAIVNSLKHLQDDVGILAPKLLFHTIGRIQSTGHWIPASKGCVEDRGIWEWDRGQFDTKYDVIGACAGAGVYSREMLEQIGLFDESFFMHYEDAELSWRAHVAGWRGRFVPDAVFEHIGGASTRTASAQLANHRRVQMNKTRAVLRHGSSTQRAIYALRAGLAFPYGAAKFYIAAPSSSPWVIARAQASFLLPVLRRGDFR